MQCFWRLRAGFTMIELIIVIAIIGILAATVYGAINPVTQIKKANDAQRQSNVKQLQSAMEQYFSNSGGVAYTCNAVTLRPFLPDGIPKDPATKQAIGCQVPDPDPSASSTTSYCISATLDFPNGNCNPDCSAATGTNTFCVKNVQ